MTRPDPEAPVQRQAPDLYAFSQLQSHQPSHRSAQRNRRLRIAVLSSARAHLSTGLPRLDGCRRSGRSVGCTEDKAGYGRRNAEAFQDTPAAQAQACNRVKDVSLVGTWPRWCSKTRRCTMSICSWLPQQQLKMPLHSPNKRMRNAAQKGFQESTSQDCHHLRRAMNQAEHQGGACWCVRAGSSQASVFQKSNILFRQQRGTRKCRRRNHTRQCRLPASAMQNRGVAC